MYEQSTLRTIENAIDLIKIIIETNATMAVLTDNSGEPITVIDVKTGVSFSSAHEDHVPTTAEKSPCALIKAEEGIPRLYYLDDPSRPLEDDNIHKRNTLYYFQYSAGECGPIKCWWTPNGHRYG
jgi:hypothetical protein